MKRNVKENKFKKRNGLREIWEKAQRGMVLFAVNETRPDGGWVSKKRMGLWLIEEKKTSSDP